MAMTYDDYVSMWQGEGLPRHMAEEEAESSMKLQREIQRENEELDRRASGGSRGRSCYTRDDGSCICSFPCGDEKCWLKWYKWARNQKKEDE